MTHICHIGSKFVWGEDVTKHRPVCECGWIGHWTYTFNQALSEWERHAL